MGPLSEAERGPSCSLTSTRAFAMASRTPAAWTRATLLAELLRQGYDVKAYTILG